MSAVFMVSLGCPKNLVDTEVMAGMLATAGYAVTGDDCEASVYLINTCAFLPSARSESRDAISDAVAWKKEAPGRRIVVAGCINEKMRGDALAILFPEVDLWLRVDDMPRLVELLEGRAEPRRSGGEPCYLADHTAPRLLLTVPHVAYLKISDGCDNRCSYCSIPGIRGGLRSRPMDSVLAEAKDLLNAGVRELVVIAQDITAYGNDRPDSGEEIAGLIRALNALDGDFRIRLLYTHPAHYTAAFIDAMGSCPKVIPYLDIPLQHINDRILAAMGRHTTRAGVEKLLAEMRSKIPGLVVRTTFIVGFPGETEAEFAELKEFMKQQRFERCGVFAFAPEPDTPAAKLSKQVPAEIAEARAAELMALQESIMLMRHREQIGKTDRVLIDEVRGSKAYGRGTFDAPDIDNRVTIAGAKNLCAGEFYDIFISGAEPYGLLGKIEKKGSK